jgi:EAL domain-containing protein (putative c-di-GMP-specific phosphodiesterase class I)
LSRDVEELLGSTAVDPARVVLKITETVQRDDLDQAAAEEA